MRQVLSIVALLVCGTLPAAAQERASVGVTMGYPPSAGIIWHVSDRVAIRPTFNFSHISAESENSPLKTSGLGSAFAVAALFYTSLDDKLRTYVSPEFAYGHATTDSEGGAPSSNTIQNLYQFAGAFGAQYALASRFSVYGEVGLAYSRNKTERTASIGTTTSDTLQTRSGVGVILYFK